MRIRFLAASFVFIVGGSILITQAQRRIPSRDVRELHRQALRGGQVPASLASVTPSNVVIQAVKRAESGEGLSIRLREVAGKKAQATVTSFRLWPDRRPRRILRR